MAKHQLPPLKEIKPEQLSDLERYNRIHREHLYNQKLERDLGHDSENRWAYRLGFFLFILVICAFVADIFLSHSIFVEAESSSTPKQEVPITSIFEQFILWLQVIVAVTFGFIAYLQWRDSQRQSRQQQTFTSYVESSTDFMSNSSELIGTMNSIMSLNKKIEDRLRSFEAKEEQKIAQTRAVQDKLDDWGIQFFNSNHRHQNNFNSLLKHQIPPQEAIRQTAGIEIKHLSCQYQLNLGQFAEKVESKIVDAISAYSAVLELNLSKNALPRISEAAYKNRGLAKHYIGDFDGAIEDFTQGSMLNQEAQQSNHLFITNARLFKARLDHSPRSVLDSIQSTYEELLRVDDRKDSMWPMTPIAYGMNIRYFYCELLIDELLSSESLDRAEKLLSWRSIQSNSQSDWIQTRYEFRRRIKPSTDELKHRLDTCALAYSKETNICDRITEMTRMIIYQAILQEEGDFRKSLTTITGDIEQKLGEDSHSTIMTHSVFNNSFESLLEFKNKFAAIRNWSFQESQDRIIYCLESDFLKNLTILNEDTDAQPPARS